MKTIRVHLLPAIVTAVFFSFPAYADTSTPLTGTYYGTVTITSPASMGVIDLALYLDISGTSIQQATSYLVLDKTLRYPAVAPRIGGKKVGPRLSGSISPTSFQVSTPVPYRSVFGDKTTTRTLALKNATVANAGTSISGDYEETVAGLGPNKFVITGKFIIVKPSPVTSQQTLVDGDENGCIDVTEIEGGGADPGMIEYSDVSQALHLYYNPSKVPNLCSPREEILNSALTDYNSTALKSNEQAD